MNHILDAVQSAFQFGPEASAIAANDALPAAAGKRMPREAAAAAIVKAGGFADYGKATSFLFRAAESAPPKA
jgi:hypothetical protein